MVYTRTTHTHTRARARTGTILVSGNKCPRRRDEEFNSLIKCIRAIYALVVRVKEPRLQETVTSNLCSLRLPTVLPSPGGEPGLHDVSPGCSPRPQLPGQPGVQEGARVDFRPSVPSQPQLRQLQSRLTSQTNRPATCFPPEPHLLPHPASQPTQSHLHHTKPELETLKQQIKAELKLHVVVKFYQLTDTVMSLTQKLPEITKQKKDIKSQIGDLSKYISVIKINLRQKMKTTITSYKLS